MVANDYGVIVYCLLSYLYDCLKTGSQPDLSMLDNYATKHNIPPSYVAYVLRNMVKSEFIEGAELVLILGQTENGVKLTERLMITPKGIEYLQENSLMSKAKEFLNAGVQATSIISKIW